MNLSAVDLNLLVALDRLLARRSVTAAARDLGLSQPAMSRTLERLRGVFADPLFVRDGRGLAPTPRALALAGPLDEALAALRRVVAPPPEFVPTHARGELRLGLADELQHLFGAAIFRAIARVAPGVDLRMIPLGEGSLEASRRGALDLALLPDLGPLPTDPRGGPPDLTELVRRELYRRRFVVVCAADRPAPLHTLDDYCAAHHVIVSSEGGSRGFVDEYLAALGRRRRVAASASTFGAAVQLAAGTDLVATVAEEVALAAGAAVRTVSPPIPLPTLAMCLWWQPVRTPEPRHRFFREIVAEAVAAAHAQLVEQPLRKIASTSAAGSPP